MLLICSFHNWYDVRTKCLLQFNHQYFFCTARVKLVKTLLFQNVLLWKNCWKSPTKAALDRNVKDTPGNCGTSVTKPHLSRHKSCCSGRILYCPNCPNFSIKSRGDLNYHIAKKHSAAGLKNNHTCKECNTEFPSFYSLRHHKQRYHTAETTSSAAETTSSGGKVDVQSLADAGEDKSLEEVLQACRHSLVDSEIQKGRHSVLSFVVNKLTAQVIEEKLDRALDKLKCAAKLNLALFFFLENIEDGKFRYFSPVRTTPCCNSQKFWVTKATW